MIFKNPNSLTNHREIPGQPFITNLQIVWIKLPVTTFIYLINTMHLNNDIQVSFLYFIVYGNLYLQSGLNFGSAAYFSIYQLLVASQSVKSHNLHNIQFSAHGSVSLSDFFRNYYIILYWTLGQHNKISILMQPAIIKYLG